MLNKRHVTLINQFSTETQSIKAILAILACCMMLLPCHAHSQTTANDPLPTKILTCGGNIITEIGPRLEGDSDMSTGFHVLFKNGGVTMNYETPEAVRNSKEGDHVLICLVYIPNNCPPGDSRGRIYTVTNLRTLHSWSAGDSQHSCGGG
jgi:hypothetical protein